ncbi:hypothetical protein Tco_0512187 [Tanacetum coccineum]
MPLYPMRYLGITSVSRVCQTCQAILLEGMGAASVFEVTLPPQKRLCIALGPSNEVGESSSAPTARLTGGFRAAYRFVGILDDEIRRDPERYVGYKITDTWDEMVEDMQDTDEIYVRLDDAQDERSLTSSQLNMLRRDRHAHARTARLMETEARLSYEAWTQVTALKSQEGPASGPTQPEIAEEAGCIANALASRDADRSRNGKDNLDLGTSVRRQAPLAHECTYPDFMKCKPLYFKGTEGVIKLTQWFERMENVFRISNCSVENQIKYSTCTLLGCALTWWNSHVKTVGHDVAYEMTWTNLKKKMTNKYYSRGEIKKLEAEM